MSAITNFLRPLVGPQCAHRLLKFDLTATECIKLFISKVLGFGIVLGGMILKVPQILKIVSAGSTAGISFASYFLETAAYTISLAYNFRSGNPFSTYGEMGFITLQNVAILFLILSYSKNLSGLLAFLVVYVATSVSLFNPDIVSTDLLRNLQWATVLIGVASKLPQIWNNYSAKSTGQLSAITVFLQSAGSAARVFTTLQEVDDPVLLTSALVATGLNALIAFQMVTYWSNRLPTSRISGHNISKNQKKNS
ncbi:hypothetical protein PhCBS80983_g01759 [Powellomyces hirtus]|uniref:Mannose-P-dolichol utilization defect 1 protein homolog n=1 Tax=Powellomyces hirtus TaxID=109895 RepID=A0A507E9Q8_9FUNG|nr:hypothetical protein PhCBS80983_g01759 [Powellomyces hirtus]